MRHPDRVVVVVSEEVVLGYYLRVPVARPLHRRRQVEPVVLWPQADLLAVLMFRRAIDIEERGGALVIGEIRRAVDVVAAGTGTIWITIVLGAV